MRSWPWYKGERYITFNVVRGENAGVELAQLRRARVDPSFDLGLFRFLQRVGRSKWYLDGTWERYEKLKEKRRRARARRERT